MAEMKNSSATIFLKTAAIGFLRSIGIGILSLFVLVVYLGVIGLLSSWSADVEILLTQTGETVQPVIVTVLNVPTGDVLADDRPSLMYTEFLSEKTVLPIHAN